MIDRNCSVPVLNGGDGRGSFTDVLSDCKGDGGCDDFISADVVFLAGSVRGMAVTASILCVVND